MMIKGKQLIKVSTDGCPFNLTAQYILYHLFGPGLVFKCEWEYMVCKTLCILKCAVEYIFALQNILIICIMTLWAFFSLNCCWNTIKMYQWEHPAYAQTCQCLFHGSLAIWLPVPLFSVFDLRQNTLDTTHIEVNLTSADSRKCCIKRETTEHSECKYSLFLACFPDCFKWKETRERERSQD